MEISGARIPGQALPHNAPLQIRTQPLRVTHPFRAACSFVQAGQPLRLCSVHCRSPAPSPVPLLSFVVTPPCQEPEVGEQVVCLPTTIQSGQPQSRLGNRAHGIMPTGSQGARGTHAFCSSQGQALTYVKVFDQLGCPKSPSPFPCPRSCEGAAAKVIQQPIPAFCFGQRSPLSSQGCPLILGTCCSPRQTAPFPARVPTHIPTEVAG